MTGDSLVSAAKNWRPRFLFWHKLSRHSFSPLHVLILKWLVINDIINFGGIIAPLPFGDDVIYEQPQIYKWRISN